MQGPTNSDNLLDKAELAAKRCVQEWVRKTLHEVFLQAVSQGWTVKHAEDPDEDHPPKIEISAHGFQRSIDTVQEVAAIWKEKLRERDYDSVAEWVEETFNKGKLSLWTQPESANGAENILTDMPGSYRQPPSENRTGNNTAENPPSALEDRLPAPVPKIPYCALRALGKRTRLGEPRLASQDALQALKDMQARGESYWPLDHEIIDRAAREMPQRVRFERSGDKSIDLTDPQGNVIFPEQHVEASSGRGEGDDNETNHGTADAAIATGVPPRERRKAKTTRPPSDVYTSTHNVNAELSISEKQTLDQLLHPPDGIDETDSGRTPNSPPLVLFGALQNVGHIHHRLLLQQQEKEQHLLSRKERKRLAQGFTEKQTRRRLRAAIQDRLYPRRVGKNSDPQKYRSRILRTEVPRTQVSDEPIARSQSHDDTNSEQMDYAFDLDLGWSLMEVRQTRRSNGNDHDGTGARMEKRLCAFSSIEMVLQDKALTQPNEEGETPGETIEQIV